jgi:hypothetical protein
MQDDSCDPVRFGMRCRIFHDWRWRRIETYCEQGHDGNQGAYDKNTQGHFRKPPALLTAACMRWLCALRGLELRQ